MRRSRTSSARESQDGDDSGPRERVSMDDTNVRARLSVEFQIRRQDIEDTITERSVRARGGPKSQLETSPDASVSSSELQPTLSSAPAATREPGPKKKKDKKKKIVEAPNWHELPLPELLNAISLPSTSEGLTAAEAAIRLEQKGPNIIDPPTESLILKILGYLFGGFNILLLGGAVLSIVAWRIGDPPDANNLGLAIILALVALISAGFNWYQEHKSSAVMNTIKKLLPTEVLVLRDGTEQICHARTLVVGDVVILRNGDRVPADLRLYDVRSMRVDQAVLTGESEAVTSTTACTDKNYLQTRNIAFCGTNVVEGSARGIVVSTGNNTVMGSIAGAASRSSARTSSLQAEIRRVVIIIAILASITAAAVILTWVFWLRISKPSFMNLPSVLATVIGIMVAFLPDGLPFCIVLALTLVAKQMSLNNVVVKHLPTVETLGTVDVIASDKTGTLTQNLMSVVHVFLAPDNLLELNGSSKKILRKMPGSKPAELIVRFSALCCGARFAPTESEIAIDVESPTIVSAAASPREADIDSRQIIGDASDTAILRFAAHNLDSVDAVRAEWPKVFEIPFNSKNKWMLTVHAIPTGFDISESILDEPESKLNNGSNAKLAQNHLKTKALLIMKGAAEIILARSSRYLDANGKIRSITDKFKSTLSQRQTQLGSQGERVLAIAYSEFRVDSRFPIFSKDFDDDRDKFGTPYAAQDLVFVGLVALMDPAREEVPPAIARLRTASVRVMMVTGDHSTTALAIARNVGIVKNDKVDFVTKDSINDLVRDNAVRGILKNSVYHHDKKKSLRSEENKLLRGTPISAAEEATEQKALVITGADMSAFDDNAWDWVIAHDEIVFARTTPEDKLKIVTELQRRNHVVSVTGDGVNDAPALRQAEAGVAMGAGSDVAKEAADIILTDNNFASILVAIEYGRLVFDNLTKVLLYLFPSGSFAEIIPVVLNVWLGLPLPLSAFLMIYLACFTDVGPALALIKEKSEGNLMLRAPRRKEEHLVRVKTFLHAYGYLGVIEVFGALTMFFWYMWDYAKMPIGSLFLAFDNFGTDNFAGSGHTAAQQMDFLRTGQTVYFVAVVVMQFGNMMATRTQFLSLFQSSPLRGTSKNPALFIAMAVSIVLAVLIVYVPPFNAIFGTRPIPFQYWFLPAIFSFVIMSADEVRKLVIRKME